MFNFYTAVRIKNQAQLLLHAKLISLLQNDLQDKRTESSSTRPINRPTHSPWSSSRPIVVFVGGEEGQSNCGEAEERDGELRPRIASSSSDPIMVFGTFFSFSLLLSFFLLVFGGCLTVKIASFGGFVLGV